MQQAAVGPLVKIFTAEQWKRFAESGEFEGSPDDQRDGFIHLSLADQVEGTLEKHFAALEAIVLAEIRAEGVALRMEVSRDGQRFPHLYRTLTSDDVLWSGDLEAWRERRANS